MKDTDEFDFDKEQFENSVPMHGYFMCRKAISIKNNTRKNLTCLDIGCGSGEMELLIHDHFKKIVGIDPTPNQIEIANSHGLVNCDFKMGTGTKLDIKDNAFDVVLIINVMHHIDSGDHLDFLKEVYRVLQPEGKFFVYEHNPLHPLVYLRFYYLSEVDKGAALSNDK